jgi:hypothetical protein
MGLKLNAAHQAHQATKVHKSALGQDLLSRLHDEHVQKDPTTSLKDLGR